MEFKRNTHSRTGADRQRIVVPTRGNTPATPSLSSHTPAPQPRQKQSLFDGDEPLIDEHELENVSFRDILRAWFKQTIKHSPLEQKHGQLKKFKNEKIKPLKNDIKWALMADLDEPVKPRREAAPEKRQLQSRTGSHQPSTAQLIDDVRPAQNNAQPGTTIDININFDSLLRLFKKLRQLAIRFILGLNKKRLAIIAAGIICLIAINAYLPQSQKTKSNDKTASTATQQTDAAKAVQQKVDPSFDTLLPQGKAPEGGFHRVSPPNRAPVYVFTDKLADVSINVSQQKVPDDFKPNVDDKIAELAKGYAATDKVMANGVTIYVGTSTTGPQSVIFKKKDLLILIKSVKKISNDKWSWYVDNLL